MDFRCVKSPLHTPFCPQVAILRFIPQSLIFLHQDIHEMFGRIEDVLESAVGIRGFVGVSSDHCIGTMSREAGFRSEDLPALLHG